MMRKIRKYTTLGISLIILIIPMFLGIYIEYLFLHDLNLFVILILIFSLLILLLIGKLIGIYGYDSESIEKMKKHDVIDVMINKDNRIRLWLFFPIIMIIEELIFRYYIIGFLLNQLDLEVIFAILISSLIFSLYHVHTWFAYKNLRILLIYLGYSFLLGLFNGCILLTLGIFPCVGIHSALAMYFYYSIYKKYFKIAN
ncbi:MAG: CPBP family intramembrane metalloprotease [Promethearchaeota archaeon]|nr:MAG: CPBP family intramembrane metalloprotease [Candidatus Lokiarchaeota archaeon]